MTAGVKNIRIFNHTMGEVCTSSTSKAAIQMAISASNEAYIEFMARELPTMSTSGKLFPGAANLKYDVCRLSTALSNFGFNSKFFLLVALFLDLYLLISLSLIAAHKSRTEMILWWSSCSVVGTIAVVVLILEGTVYFLYTLEYLVRIRFPFAYDQILYSRHFMDMFKFIVVRILGPVTGEHCVLVRFFGRSWSLTYTKCVKDESNNTESCTEIMVIQDRCGKKLVLWKFDFQILLLSGMCTQVFDEQNGGYKSTKRIQKHSMICEWWISFRITISRKNSLWVRIWYKRTNVCEWWILL